jgi:hypothetical protein
VRTLPETGEPLSQRLRLVSDATAGQRHCILSPRPQAPVL